MVRVYGEQRNSLAISDASTETASDPTLLYLNTPRQ